MQLLRGETISKYFGGLGAVDGVDFHIERGEMLGLIGPNGSGKSTLVNVITGVYDLSGGRLFFNEKDITTLPAHLRAEMGLARTFQVVKPFRGITIRENVLIGALFGKKEKDRGMRVAHRIADEVLHFVNLFEKSNQKIENLTTAERKRVDLARTLAMKPVLLFLDEVMAGLTPKEVDEFMLLINRINEAGTTVLIIEHVMKAIMGLAKKILVLHHGKKIAEGSPGEIIRNEEVIKAYLGEKYSRLKAAD